MGRAMRRNSRGGRWKWRNLARKSVGPRGVGEAEWNPASERSDEMEVGPSSVPGRKRGSDAVQLARDTGVGALSACPSGSSVDWGGGSQAPPAPIICSGSVSSVSVGAGSFFSSFHGATPSPACILREELQSDGCAGGIQRDFDKLAFGALHQLRRRRGLAGKDSKALVDDGHDGL